MRNAFSQLDGLNANGMAANSLGWSEAEPQEGCREEIPFDLKAARQRGRIDFGCAFRMPTGVDMCQRFAALTGQIVLLMPGTQGSAALYPGLLAAMPSALL